MKVQVRPRSITAVKRKGRTRTKRDSSKGAENPKLLCFEISLKRRIRIRQDKARTVV